MLAEVTGEEVLVEHEPAQPGDVDRTGGSIDRARELLGWEPQVLLRDGLAAEYAWLRTVDG